MLIFAGYNLVQPINCQLTMNQVQYREEIDQQAHQKGTVRRRIIQHNKKLVSGYADLPSKLVNLRAVISMPSPPPQKLFFLDSIRTIPRAPQHSSQLKYPFYFRKFRYIYFLIGSPALGIWNSLKKAYEQYVPEQQRPLANLVSAQDEQKQKMIWKALEGFLSSNLQVRIILEKQTQETALRIEERLTEFLKREQIIEVISERRLSRVSRKIRYVDSMELFFQKQGSRIVRRSVNDKIVLQYNFINTKAPSSEVFNIKNLIQKCLEVRENSEYLAIHKKFAQYMEKYENQKLLRIIDQNHELTQLQKNGRNINQQIGKCYKQIARIQAEEQQFLSYFEKYLHRSDPIEKQPQLRDILFNLILEYKKEHSFYEVINTNIRLSLSPNQSVIKSLSVTIKYLFEAIQIFFLDYRAKFDFKQLYRGCLFSKEEIENLHPGDIVRNLGFMSTSKRREVAESFRRDEGYIVIIDVKDYYKTTTEDIEGLMDLNLLMNEKRDSFAKDMTAEQQVLVNPFNVFRVTKVDVVNKQITLQYAPQLELIDKISRNIATEEQVKEYNKMKLNIQSLNKSTYDKGMMLHKKGETTKAIQYYNEAESKGEVLTAEEKFNKITILKENRDLNEVSKELKQVIKKMEIEQSQKSLETSAKQDKVKWIKNLTHISQLLQETMNFQQAENKATMAEKVSQNLSSEVAKNTEMSRKQMLETMYLNLLPAIELARSKNSTIEIEESLCKIFEGFIIIDKMYAIYNEDVVPSLQQTIRDIPAKMRELSQPKCRVLFGRCLEPLQYILHQKQYFAILNNFLQHKQREVHNLKLATKTKSEEGRLLVQNIITRYFKQRMKTKNRLSLMFEAFYPAAVEIEQVSGQSQEFRILKDSFTSFREGIEELIKCEKQLYDIMKINLKNFNIEVRSCLEDEKQNFYGRFEKFQPDKITEELKKQSLDTDTIKQYSRYATFLIELTDIERDSRASEQHKEHSNNILKQLSQKIVRQEEGNSEVKLTKEKTIVIESQIQAFKNHYNEDQIINKSAVANKAGAGSVPFKSVAGAKMRTIFQEIRRLLDELEDLHESDSEINSFYYSLKDTRDKIQLLNESKSISESPEQYQKFLIEASHSYESFKLKYFAKMEENKYSQKLAELYCEVAENNLRRGFFKQAEKQLQQLEYTFSKIYQLADKVGKPKNKLFARDLPIKAYRLKAELIGIYGDQGERYRLTDELIEYKQQVIDKYAASKVNSCALISEAIAFVASRCIPKKVDNESKVYLRCAQTAFERSIELRTSMLGEDNQYLAIAYANLVMLGCKKNKDRELQYNKALKIFSTLAAPIHDQSTRSYFDANPALYLCLMNMQTTYKLQFESEDRRENAKMEIENSYKNNCFHFMAKRKDLKSIEAAENFYVAGKYLSLNDKYKQESEQMLIACEQEINAIRDMNEQGQEGQQAKTRVNIDFMRLNLFSALAHFYGKNGDIERKKKYEAAKDTIFSLFKNKDQEAVPGRPRPKSPNFIEFTVQMLQKCTGFQR